MVDAWTPTPNLDASGRAYGRAYPVHPTQTHSTPGPATGPHHVKPRFDNKLCVYVTHPLDENTPALPHGTRQDCP